MVFLHGYYLFVSLGSWGFETLPGQVLFSLWGIFWALFCFCRLLSGPVDGWV